jgi:hypothetical protein
MNKEDVEKDTPVMMAERTEAAAKAEAAARAAAAEAKTSAKIKAAKVKATQERGGTAKNEIETKEDREQSVRTP